MKLRKVMSAIVLVLASIAPVAVCQTARDYGTKGVKALNKGLFDEAVANFTKAIEVRPHEKNPYLPPFFYQIRGRAYMGKGQHDQAIADYDEALKLDPTDVFVKEDRDVAIETKKSGAKIDYRDDQDIDKAGNINIYGIKVEPRPARGWDDCVKGIKALSKGLFDQAVANFTKAIELEPDRYSYYQLRGRAYMGKSQTDQAIADYDKALKLAKFDNAKASIEKDRNLAIKGPGHKIDYREYEEVDETARRLSIEDIDITVD